MKNRLNIRAVSAALLILLALVTGCANLGTSLAEHSQRVTALREQLPYKTRIGRMRSMDTVLVADQQRLVQALPYDQLQAGDIAVFWPLGYPTPVAHFVSGRVGSDSWDTHGMAHGSDLTNGLGFLLTRENYIGVIF